jgi:putative transposase
MPIKNSYHPHVLVAYYLNCLPEHILNVIPRSTRYDWQHREIQHSFGYDWSKENEAMFDTLTMVAQNKKLLLLNKCLLRIIAIKRFIEVNTKKIAGKSATWKNVVVGSIKKIAIYFSVTKTLRYLNLGFNQYALLRRKACTTSPLHLCKIKHPAQLLPTEVATIKNYCLEGSYQFWPLSSIYHQMKKDNAGWMNLSTFYKYVSLLNLKRDSVKSRRKNHQMGIRASASLEVLHADVTEFKTADYQKAYIYLVQDNFSRAILCYRVSKERRASYTLENLAKVKAAYLNPAKINECILLTDDGSENYGEARKWMEESTRPKIIHKIAQVDVHYSNSMIEAANKQLKYRFLYNQPIGDYRQLEHYVTKAVEDFNNRPHHVLKGLSPMEVLQGMNFNNVQEGESLLRAKQNRFNKNKGLECCQI